MWKLHLRRQQLAIDISHFRINWENLAINLHYDKSTKPFVKLRRRLMTCNLVSKNRASGFTKKFTPSNILRRFEIIFEIVLRQPIIDNRLIEWPLCYVQLPHLAPIYLVISSLCINLRYIVLRLRLQESILRRCGTIDLNFFNLKGKKRVIISFAIS